MLSEGGLGWDVHTHLIPPALVDAARRGQLGMTVEGDQLVTAAARVPLRRIARPDLLEDWVEENRLDGAVVSPPPPLFRVDLEDKRGWIEKVNRGLAEACAGHERLRAMAYLPVEAPELAAEMVGGLDQNWAGVTVGTDLDGLTFSDPRYQPLWAELEGRGLPVFIHPGECHDDRLAPFYLKNLLGNPYETTVAAAHLILGGVLQDHPELRVLLAHGGGGVAALIGRWDRGYQVGRVGEGLQVSPRELARRLYVDSLVHDPAALRLIVEVFGSDRVVFGSDWPFPMGVDRIPFLNDLGQQMGYTSRSLFGEGR